MTTEITQIGDWQKICELGSGAFGIVTLWNNNSSNDFVAIKKCKFKLNVNLTSKQKERWHKEVEIMKMINHPNIIKYKQIPSEMEAVLLKRNPMKLPLLPMEYCRNGNLRTMLRKCKNVAGLDERDVRYVLSDLAYGLEHLHKLNITHRDIKPENVVLQHCDDRPGNTIYKIIDLGYAKELNDSVLSFVGTLHYLAPEMFLTERYTKSVDYWSLGLLTFEIICGVLPFLPHLQPMQRIDKIRTKDVDDICIYLNYSGQVTNSTEIRKENFISFCLKQNIEVWLRHVLQFDQNRRSQPFPNNVGVFKYLQDVLNKDIINVVSLNKLELYSYEINDSMLLSTLKDWICRDIKASRNEIILLVRREEVLMDDTRLLVDSLGEDRVVYVIKKYDLVGDACTYTFPKLVREALKSAKKFNLTYKELLYTQTIYYIKTEKEMAEHFHAGFNLYMFYLGYLVEALKKNGRVTSENLSKLLAKVDYLNGIRSKNVLEMHLDDNREYSYGLNVYRRLIASVERSVKNFAELQTKIAIIKKRKLIVESFLSVIQNIMEKYNLSTQYMAITQLLEKREGLKTNMSVFSITGIILDAIKCKDKLFRNKQFIAYIRAVGIVLKQTEQLIVWMEEFNSHIVELSAAFEQSETFYLEIVRKISENNNNIKKGKSRSSDSLSVELHQLPSIYLVKENIGICTKLEEIISKYIQDHNDYFKSLDL